MGVQQRKPRFYFSFRSPYAWIASRRIEEHDQLDSDALEYIPIWEPDAQTMESLTALGGDFLYARMSKAKRLYILQDIKRLTTQLGYAMTWPIDRSPHWEIPHLAYLLARSYGKGEIFLKRLYQLRWQQGENICDTDLMGRLALDMNLDPEEFSSILTNVDIRKLGVEMLYNAYKEGVFGFPFFVSRNGRHKFWGTDRLDYFIDDVLQEMAVVA